jgi:predicted PurR-regulated permease PerM
VAVPVAPESKGLVASVAETAPDIIAKIVYVTVLTIFLLAYRRQYTSQLIMLPRRFEHRLRMARIARDVRNRVAGYLFTLSMINIGLAFVTTVSFALLGIHNPVLWGILFGFFNFVPVIGPTTIIIAAALVGLATAPTLLAALIPPATLLVLNTIEANLVQPLLLARRLVISPIAIFITVATLVWMWGPPSAIVAIPTLILIHAVMLHVPSMRHFAMMLATVDGNRSGQRRLKAAALPAQPSGLQRGR